MRVIPPPPVSRLAGTVGDTQVGRVVADQMGVHRADDVLVKAMTSAVWTASAVLALAASAAIRVADRRAALVSGPRVR
jgi:hypothetical protein